MRKTFLKFFCAIFLFVIFITNSVQLVIPVIPVNGNPKEELILNFFYNGAEYKTKIKDSTGSQINIDDKKFNQRIFILISQEIEIIQSLASGRNIKGLKVKQDSDYLFFEVNLIVEEDKKKLVYTWEMKNINIGDCCFPENTLILYASPSSISIENDSKNFFINLSPTEKNTFPPLIILPAIYVDSEKFSKLDFAGISSIPDMKKIHTPKFS